jgi:S-layer protein
VNLGKSAASNAGALGAALTVTDGADNSTTTDTATINNTAINTTSGANLALAADLTSVGYENLVFNTGSGSGNTEQAMPTITLTSDSATAPVSLTLKGNNAIDISTQVTTNSTSLTIDGSALKAQAAGTTSFEIDSTTIAATGTLTITGSDGEDIFGDATAGVHASLATTITSGAGVDTIFTGTGNDTVTAGSGKDVIDTSSGNDTIDAGADDDTIDMAGNLTLLDSVDGGDGTDTIKLNNTDATTVNAYSLGQIATLNGQLSNIEKIDFGTGSLAQSIDVGRLDNISTVEFVGIGAASSILGLAATNEVILREDTGFALTLGLADATGTADSLTITMKESDALVGNTITAANIETINLSGIDDAAGDSSTVNTMTLVASKATSVVVTGNDGLNLTSTGSTRITNFDASAVAATNSSDTVANMKVTYTSANSSASASVTIKGGAGEDVLAGNAGIDTISGGAAADAITMTAGNDVVTGDAGGDTYLTTEALMIANSGTTATFDGGAGTDILDFNEDNVINVVDADFRGFTSVESLTTGDGTNNVVMAGNADTAGFTSITGGTGKDTFNLSDAAFDNAITIDLAGGVDVLTLSTDVAQVATVNQDAGDQTAASGGTANASSDAIAAAETLVFGGGVDTINGFTAGTDKIDFTNTGAAVTAIGVSEEALTASSIFFLSGALVGTTFTIAADGAGADTLVFENETTGVNDDLDTVNNMLLLAGVDSDDLTATTFV